MASNNAPTLNATVRDAAGTGAARRVRVQGLVPAVCYGHGIDENLNIAIDPEEFDKIMEQPHEINTLFSIELDDGTKIDNLMLRDYQVDPIKRVLTHTDLVAVDPEKPLRVEIPVKAEGEAAGTKVGGRLQFIQHRVAVFVPPAEIPEALTVDVTELGPDDAIMADDLEYPESAVPAHKVNFAVVRIQMPRAKIVVAPAPGTTAAVTPTTEEGEELEEGAEAAEEGEDTGGSDFSPPGA